MDLEIAADDARRDDVRTLLETHQSFAREVTPPEDVHALDVDALLDPTVTVFSARQAGSLRFTPCEPFGAYTDHAGSVCMTIELGPVDGADR